MPPMTIRRPALRLALAGLAALLLLGTSGARAVDVTVRIENFTFEPQKVTVPVGTTVVFENADDIPHLVVATDGSFRSKALDTGDTFTLKVEKPGELAYFCALHPHMQGTISVTQ